MLTAVPDLKQTLLRYIHQSNKTAIPIKWRHAGLLCCIPNHHL